MAFVNELLIPRFKNVQVQAFAGINDNTQWKYWNKVGHAVFEIR